MHSVLCGTDVTFMQPNANCSTLQCRANEQSTDVCGLLLLVVVVVVVMSGGGGGGGVHLKTYYLSNIVKKQLI